MARNRPDRYSSGPPASESTEAAVPSWTRGKCWLVSIAIVLHLSAVIAAPLASPPPSSPLQRSVAGTFDPYLQALFLNHGYRFFAPQPGPNHGIEYVVTRSDGTTVSGRFPDRRQHWPRLLYHRWFMLAETVYAESAMLPDAQQEQQWREGVQAEIRELHEMGRLRLARQREQFFGIEQTQLQASRRRQALLTESIARWLMRRHDGARVELEVVQRAIPSPADVIDGIPLDDARYTQIRIPLGTFLADSERGATGVVAPPTSSQVEWEELPQ